MEKEDNEKTTFGGLVSTGARKGFKTLNRILERNSKTENILNIFYLKIYFTSADVRHTGFRSFSQIDDSLAI